MYKVYKRITESAPKSISLKELPIDLYDETEAISLALENYGDDIVFKKFEVKTITPEEMKYLQNNFMDIEEAFEQKATTKQHKIVNRYIDKMEKGSLTFPDNLIILDGKEVIDGNHRVIAGIKSNTSLLYIDISD